MSGKNRSEQRANQIYDEIFFIRLSDFSVSFSVSSEFGNDGVVVVVVILRVL